jgi:hypothetical protein
MFSFTDNNFTGGNLESTIGKGYLGGKNIDVSGLVLGDWFGSAVALNATGDRLAIGAYGDNGASGAAFNSGAVRLFSFSDANFTGGSLQSTIGKGYVGGNNVDFSTLENDDYFGISLAFNAAGNRLAVGAYGDDGAGNLAVDSGAAYLFSFADSNFNGASLESTIGKGYIGGKNVDVANLAGADAFGSAVALNAAGDRLAVGAYADDGAGNLAADSGAVYQFDFSDTNFSGASLQTVFGKGYTGLGTVDLTGLQAGDRFGSAVAVNGVGNRLAVGANGDDGAGNLVTDSGAVYLFSQLTDSIASGSSFADRQSDSVTFSDTELETILSAGTNVVLQANNDITVASAVTVNNAGGNGGKLTLQAGRNINFNADVTTDNGDLLAVAGDPGAIASERDAGTPTLTIASGVTINAGSGVVNLAAVGGNFVNSPGSATPITASQWYVYSTDPASNTLGGMTPTGKHYNQAYVSGTTPSYAASGSWLLYSLAPVLYVAPSAQVIDYGASPAPFSPIYSGFIDGDTALTADISGTAAFSSGGSNAGAYDINYLNGLASGLGYTFANNAASTAELVINSQAMDDAKNDAQKGIETKDANPAAIKKASQGSCDAGSIVSTYANRNIDRFLENEQSTSDDDAAADDDCDMLEAFHSDCPLW